MQTRHVFEFELRAQRTTQSSQAVIMNLERYTVHLALHGSVQAMHRESGLSFPDKDCRAERIKASERDEHHVSAGSKWDMRKPIQIGNVVHGTEVREDAVERFGGSRG